MSSRIAAADPIPLYHRVYLLLRQQIVEGVWSPEVLMPGEHELAETNGVSRITIRRALQRLEQEKLVLRRRGAGTHARPPAPPKRRENLRGLMENLLAMGLRTKVQLISFDYVAAPPEVAAWLEAPLGAVVQKSVRVRSVKGVPFSHLTTWVPEEIGRRLRAEDLASRPLLQLLEEIGAQPAQAEQVISARLADAQVARALQVDVGCALLWVRRQVRDPSRRVIEAIEALYRPDMYEYQIAMVREDGMWGVDRASQA
ncbi:MAG: GntR family transcriptional regulator [Rhodospirillales bacterium]|nr:GntR family transcriptional regulator [Rhodospirillales bacterium]